MTPQELSQFFQFPKNPKNETSLLKVTSKKLSLPIGIPTFNYEKLKNGEILPSESPHEINILGSSDYRSTTVPVGMYDEDRLRHMYIIGKTGTGKSKFMLSLMIDDILKGKGMAIIDPHGDAIEELLQFVPESRKNDVIIFDPMDEKFPFCLNPLDVSETDSKQVLAK
jgi:Cdc6-like AAA superfamily ATPase